MIDSERVEKAARELLDRTELSPTSGWQWRLVPVAAIRALHAALTADAQPVGDAPLEREQNYALALKLIKRAQQSKEPHIWIPYFSTYCLHGNHEACRANCESCQNPCKCDCGHPAPEPLVYKDADARHDSMCRCKQCSNRALGVLSFDLEAIQTIREEWDHVTEAELQEIRKCLGSGVTEYQFWLESRIAAMKAAPLHSWEQLEKALRGTFHAWNMASFQIGAASCTVSRLLELVRARLTARERVTKPLDITYRPTDASSFNPTVCGVCGAWVIDQLAHTGWHNNIGDAERYANGLRQELAQQKAAKEGQ
jgi:hypothetical protein